MSTRLEHFPNELLLSLFDYFDIPELHHTFWGINQRFNNLLRSLTNLFFIITKNHLLLLEIFARQITRLKVDTSQNINLTQFPNLHSLELCRASDIQMEQIRSAIMPKLNSLIISTPFRISLPLELIQQIFSNSFRSLHYARLARLDTFQISPNFQSLSLHSLYITCTDTNVIPQILSACPNLVCFHVTFFGQNHHILPPSSAFYNHTLEKFYLHDPYYKLTYETIDILFLYISHVKYLFLQFSCRVPFVHLIEKILKRLEELNQFECDILEVANDQMVNVEVIQQMNECFERLQCIEKDNGDRLFLTE